METRNNLIPNPKQLLMSLFVGEHSWMETWLQRQRTCDRLCPYLLGNTVEWKLLAGDTPTKYNYELMSLFVGEHSWMETQWWFEHQLQEGWSPYLLGNTVEWKQTMPHSIPQMRAVTSPYLLGNTVEWKLVALVFSDLARRSPYLLGNTVEWKRNVCCYYSIRQQKSLLVGEHSWMETAQT